MGELKVLPSQLANMIAAGEVVQRPASIVKELMENAVDAGATQVNVIVTDAGRTRIRVIDNGCGMSPTDAVLCFERHATSKISDPSDLEAIMTYGFRGEALASIAAVSEVTLKTRRASDAAATKVELGDFGHVSTSQCEAPVGSNFSISNLFYNTPARRKFLKSDNVELKHIIEEFTRVAITRPQTGFTLTSGNRDIFVLKPAKSLKFRVLDLMGSNVADSIVDIDVQTSSVNISGFLGRPDVARKTVGNQYFFVNGRFFRSAYLHKAVMKAYEELMPDGMTPSYFLFLEVDPHAIDVNIHPTKTEIKFEDDSLIFQILYACVKETLGRNSFGASIDFDTEGAVELPQLGSSFEQYRGISQPSAAADPSYNPFDFTDAARRFESEHSGESHYSTEKQDYTPLFKEPGALSERVPSSIQGGSAAPARELIIRGNYIVSGVSGGLMFVNVHRAWERVMYDRAIDALSKNGHVSQTALFPVLVAVGAAQQTVFAENSEMLSKLGFEIAVEGTDAVLVSAVPEGFSCEQGSIERCVGELLFILEDGKDNLPELMVQKMAERFAAAGASGDGEVKTQAQAASLLEALMESSNPEFTPGGKRITVIESFEEIEKRF